MDIDFSCQIDGMLRRGLRLEPEGRRWNALRHDVDHGRLARRSLALATGSLIGSDAGPLVSRRAHTDMKRSSACAELIRKLDGGRPEARPRADPLSQSR